MDEELEDLLERTESDSQEDVVKRLRRIRVMLCPNQKYEDEVERCPCSRGGHDAGLAHGSETGCKDIMDAINRINNDQDG